MKKKSNLRRLFGYSYTMGGTALIAGGLPSPAKEPVQAVATAGAPFVAPMASVTGAGLVVKHLSKLKPKKTKRRYK